jgi:hypothetical protein
VDGKSLLVEVGRSPELTLHVVAAIQVSNMGLFIHPSPTIWACRASRWPTGPARPTWMLACATMG